MSFFIYLDYLSYFFKKILYISYNLFDPKLKLITLYI
jgi:hypothetical protein